MNKVYLIGNGYVCDYISELRDNSSEYIGVCRSKKDNFDYNIELDISKKMKDYLNLFKMCHKLFT